MPTPKPASPARLSSLSTTTLTQILELTRSHQLNLTPSASLVPNIKHNLKVLKDGIEELEKPSSAYADEEEVREGLRKQFERLVDLMGGLGVDVSEFKAPELLGNDTR